MKDYNRTADDDVYLNEDRYNNPKELFKQIVGQLELLSKENISRNKKLIDIGGGYRRICVLCAHN